MIVSTHVNSKRTYYILHRNGVDLILYKDHPQYSHNYVLNKFINLRREPSNKPAGSVEEIIKENENKISDYIYHELDLIGISSKLKGRDYIHDAVLYLIENENSDISVIQYLTKIYKKSATTITNGIQNAIIHGWRVTSVEDLNTYYTARVNYETIHRLIASFRWYFYYNKMERAQKRKKVVENMKEWAEALAKWLSFWIG